MWDYDLMIPGPVAVTPQVLSEMAQPITEHYGPKWASLYNDSVRRLKKLIGTKSSELFIINGSGHAAIDMALNSLVESDNDVILVFSTGFWGERTSKLAMTYSSNTVVIKLPWGSCVSGRDVEKVINQYPEAKILVLQHNETSTGVLNDLADIGRITKRADVLFCVDGVSSIGIEPFNMDDWNIDVALAASQKCLESPPGLAIIAMSQRALQAVKNRSRPPRGWYLNIQAWIQYKDQYEDWQPHFITIAENEVRALNRSLRNIEAEGLIARRKRHEEIAYIVRMTLRAMGLKVISPDSQMSRCVTVFETPHGISARKLVDYLKSKYGVLVSTGAGEMEDMVVRIGHMGPSARISKVLPVLVGIEDFLRHQGLKIKQGASLEYIMRLNNLDEKHDIMIGGD